MRWRLPRDSWKSSVQEGNSRSGHKSGQVQVSCRTSLELGEKQRQKQERSTIAICQSIQEVAEGGNSRSGHKSGQVKSRSVVEQAQEWDRNNDRNVQRQKRLLQKKYRLGMETTVEQVRFKNGKNYQNKSRLGINN